MIEYRMHPDGTSYVVTLACPLCEEDLPEQLGLAAHLRNGCPAV